VSPRHHPPFTRCRRCTPFPICSPPNRPSHMLAWSSPFLIRLNKTTSDFLSHVSSHPASLFEPHGPRWIMAHALISMGGLGIQAILPEQLHHLPSPSLDPFDVLSMAYTQNTPKIFASKLTPSLTNRLENIFCTPSCILPTTVTRPSCTARLQRYRQPPCSFGRNSTACHPRMRPSLDSQETRTQSLLLYRT
jgi:hypothetical protein